MPAIDFNLDLTGANAGNRITAEIQAVVPLSDRSVFPLHGPFFGNEPSFTVEGKIGAGPWAELDANVDFLYSPQYVEFSTMVGKEIFSYVLIINDNIDQIRFTYQALGKYTDTALLAEITAAGSFNRYDLLEWAKFYGDVVNHHAYVSDPNVIGKSLLEVVHLQLEKLANIIANPNSTTILKPSDITSLKLDLANKADLSALDTTYRVTALSAISAAAGVDTDLHIMANDVNVLTGQIFMRGAGAPLSGTLVTFKAVKPSDSETFEIEIVSSEGIGLTPAITIVLSGSELILRAMFVSAVTYQVKILSEFEGV